MSDRWDAEAERRARERELRDGDFYQPRVGRPDTRTWREEDHIQRDAEGYQAALHGRPAQFTPQDFRGEGEIPRPGSERNRDSRGAMDRAGDFLHRAGERMASWFGDADEAPGPVGNRGKGPRGYVRSDERISDDVHERLTEDFWLDASDTTVAVLSGEVTLAGTVADRRSKHRAERLVEDILGVKHVQNNLRVRAPEPDEDAPAI